jgi:GNAT superfamily N-acetyltransferase
MPVVSHSMDTIRCVTPVPTRATADQIPRLAHTYASAFIDDPMIRWPFPTDAGLDDYAAMFQTLLVQYIQIGVVWQVDDCAGAAAWLPPEDAERFEEIELTTREQIAPLTDDDGARYGKLWDWLGSHIPDEPCWFLDMIAVHPDHQGRGLGRILIEHGLAGARKEGSPAFLETSQQANIGYYQTFGFDVVAHEQAPGGGPEIWFMRHPA